VLATLRRRVSLCFREDASRQLIANGNALRGQLRYSVTGWFGFQNSLKYEEESDPPSKTYINQAVSSALTVNAAPLTASGRILVK